MKNEIIASIYYFYFKGDIFRGGIWKKNLRKHFGTDSSYREILIWNEEEMITKVEFEKLFDDSITVKEHSQIVEKITQRCAEIIKVMCPNKYWWDFDTGTYEGEKSDGFFNPIRYKEEISIMGENLNMPEPFVDSFPTRWLWEDFEPEFRKTVADFKAQKDAKKAAKKQTKSNKKQQIIMSIKSKLTPEELKLVRFK